MIHHTQHPLDRRVAHGVVHRRGRVQQHQTEAVGGQTEGRLRRAGHEPLHRQGSRTHQGQQRAETVGDGVGQLLAGALHAVHRFTCHNILLLWSLKQPHLISNISIYRFYRYVKRIPWIIF